MKKKPTKKVTQFHGNSIINEFLKNGDLQKWRTVSEAMKWIVDNGIDELYRRFNEKK